MKRKVLASTLSIVLAGSMFLSPVVSHADNEESKEQSAYSEVYETIPLDSSISTASQQQANENVIDVDSDIHSEVDAEVPDTWEEIEIATVDDFLEFAENCKLDIWSLNKKVTLTNDISLLGVDFTGVSTFGGIFDGNGHSISDVNISKEVSYAGLFCKLQETGIIKNLKVTGNIFPAGNQIRIGGIVGDSAGLIVDCTFKGVISGSDYIGGIAGVNELTGVISYCECDGYIHGKHFTGGIVGENMGNIVNCLNGSMVNTSNTDTQMTIDAMSNLNKVLSIIKNGTDNSETASEDTTASDTGGIAGLSIGIISRCLNNGSVGYEHVGYNVGGIAGRQSGYVLECTNNGKILGRKDVGGIVGQAEPYITVDLSSDIAYQLSEAIEKLHDIISVTLNDAKTQSNVISNRLAVIQQFTSGAIADVQYIANGTVDFANGVSGAATEAFSRIDYVLDEAAKKDGMMDQVGYAAENARSSADNLTKTIKDLNIDNYLSDEEKTRYNSAKQTIETSTSTYTALTEKAYKAYYNKYISGAKVQGTYSAADLQYKEGDLDYTDDSNDPSDFTSEHALGLTDAEEIISVYNVKGSWSHSGDGAAFPVTDVSDERNENDLKLEKEASDKAISDSQNYADNRFASDHSGMTYEGTIADASQTISNILTTHLDEMADTTRADALKAGNNLKSATDNIYNAGKEAKSIVSTVAGYNNIAFPQLGEDYKAHTSSLAGNMQGMNDNFGLLNSEINNATGVLVDDLQSVTDQFNTIMLLYTDAIDGVLEMDYTTAYEDISLNEASTTMDATVDDCINFGTVEGDISTSGIAGTMAIEYDFDMESDITGIRDSKMSTSYITKCVLRNNNNYGVVTGEKNYAGGICGLQEMGTILGCGNYANIKSSSGQYVGGVAGSSLSYVVSSFSRGILDGKSYVGGIAGDGMHIRNSFSLVKLQNEDSWYGAIAGHIADGGEVRNNYFVSDELAGIDRVSYTKKAEPISYEEAMSRDIFSAYTGEEGENDGNVYKTNVPDTFKTLTITYMLEDEDFDEPLQILKQKKKYGESLKETDYPAVDDKEGYYVTWDYDNIDSLETDMVITAGYTKYKTTISENDTVKDTHQSEVLIDGKFKEDDELTVNRRDVVEWNELSLLEDRDYDSYETIDLVIPDDGADTHVLRFKPSSGFYDMTGEYVLFDATGDLKTPLESTGTFGKYNTYELKGNNHTLMVRYEGLHKKVTIGVVVVIIAVIVVFAIIVLLIIVGRKRGMMLPKAFKTLKQNVSNKIESKEQIFYNEDDEKKNDK